MHTPDADEYASAFMSSQIERNRREAEEKRTAEARIEKLELQVAVLVDALLNGGALSVDWAAWVKNHPAFKAEA